MGMAASEAATSEGSAPRPLGGGDWGREAGAGLAELRERPELGRVLKLNFLRTLADRELEHLLVSPSSRPSTVLASAATAHRCGGAHRRARLSVVPTRLLLLDRTAMAIGIRRWSRGGKLPPPRNLESGSGVTD